MKKLLLLLLCVPLIGFGQTTMIPDASFEQRLISFGYDDILDGTVLTAAIDTVTQLGVSYYGISDLTGIEDFAALTYLNCGANDLTSIDISQNTNLTSFNCTMNQLTSLDVSQNMDLNYLYCGWNQLTNLNVSQCANLTDLHCNDNQLTSLDIRNNNNTNMGSIQAVNNLNLTCISVDDFQFSISNWTNSFLFGFDSQHYFSNNCSETTIEESTTNKEVLKITDMLGRDTNNKGFNIEIYDDGSVEKKYVIE